MRDEGANGCARRVVLTFGTGPERIVSGYLAQRRLTRHCGCARRAIVQSFRNQEPGFGKLWRIGSHSWAVLINTDRAS